MKDALAGLLSLIEKAVSRFEFCSLNCVVAFVSRHKQGSRSITKSRFLRIHIRASTQVLFNRFDVPLFGSFVN